jgi:iron complex transport system ATP-binding protein
MTLAVHDLHFGYPGHIVGNGVSVQVAPGETLALLGPNGGGKTTLLKTMLGLLKPLGGMVTLDGRPLADMPVDALARRIGYVPQAHAGAFGFAVRDVVLMGRTAHQGLFAAPTRADRDIAEAKLDELGIAHLAERPYTMISGGERQLVLIARALAQEPRYVVLDEPTAGLDFGNQGKVMRRIKWLAGKGLGVLFTTHDPNQAMRYADRVALLSGGRLSAEGTPRKVLSAAALSDLYGSDVCIVREQDLTVFLPD